MLLIPAVAAPPHPQLPPPLPFPQAHSFSTRVGLECLAWNPGLHPNELAVALGSAHEVFIYDLTYKSSTPAHVLRRQAGAAAAGGGGGGGGNTALLYVRAPGGSRRAAPPASSRGSAGGGGGASPRVFDVVSGSWEEAAAFDGGGGGGGGDGAGNLLAVGDSDGRVRLFDLRKRPDIYPVWTVDAAVALAGGTTMVEASHPPVHVFQRRVGGFECAAAAAAATAAETAAGDAAQRRLAQQTVSSALTTAAVFSSAAAPRGAGGGGSVAGGAPARSVSAAASAIAEPPMAAAPARQPASAAVGAPITARPASSAAPGKLAAAAATLAPRPAPTNSGSMRSAPLIASSLPPAPPPPRPPQPQPPQQPLLNPLGNIYGSAAAAVEATNLRGFYDAGASEVTLGAKRHRGGEEELRRLALRAGLPGHGATPRATDSAALTAFLASAGAPLPAATATAGSASARSALLASSAAAAAASRASAPSSRRDALAAAIPAVAAPLIGARPSSKVPTPQSLFPAAAAAAAVPAASAAAAAAKPTPATATAAPASAGTAERRSGLPLAAAAVAARPTPAPALLPSGPPAVSRSALAAPPASSAAAAVAPPPPPPSAVPSGGAPLRFSTASQWPRGSLSVRALLQPETGGGGHLLYAITRGGAVVGWDMRRMQQAAFSVASAPAAVRVWDALTAVLASPLRPAHGAAAAAATASSSAAAAAAGGGGAAGRWAGAPLLHGSVQSALPHPSVADWCSMVLDDGLQATFSLSRGSLVGSAAPALDAALWAAGAPPNAACIAPLPGGAALLCSPLRLAPRAPATIAAPIAGSRNREGHLVVGRAALEQPPENALHCEMCPRPREHWQRRRRRRGGSADSGSEVSAEDGDDGGGSGNAGSGGGAAAWARAGVYPSVSGIGRHDAPDSPCVARIHPRCYTTLVAGTATGDVVVVDAPICEVE